MSEKDDINIISSKNQTSTCIYLQLAKNISDFIFQRKLTKILGII